jgi:hypothetical protein
MDSRYLQRFITKTADVVISGTTTVKEIDQRVSQCLGSVAKMAENKMEAVAQLFGKKLNERFTVRYDNCLFDCKFTDCGFTSYGAYENPYLDCDAFILQDLLVGRAVIVDE